MKTTRFFLGLSILFFAVSCGTKSTSNEQAKENKDKTFQSIDIKNLEDNAVSLFADNWFVVSAGDQENFNQMTISWGMLGNIWGSPAVTIYIRSTRHTYPLIDNGKYFTLCAFDDEYRDKVLLIGSNSGRDMDKIEATGLTPKFTELGNVYYEEARLVIECEKTYFNDLIPANMTDPEALKMYENETTMHRMFIGKIVNVWEKK